MDPFKAALGLDQSASREEIMRAYRKLALQFHPDKHTHSTDSIRDAATLRFKFVSQAYEALLDELKRSSDNNPGSSNNEYHSSSSNNNNEHHSSSRSRSSSNNNEHHSSSSSRSSSNNNEHHSSSSSSRNNKRSSNNYNYNDNGRRSSYSHSGYQYSSYDLWIWKYRNLLKFSPLIFVGGILAIGGYRKMNRGKSYEDYMLETMERVKAASAAKYPAKTQNTMTLSRARCESLKKLCGFK